MYKGYRVLLGNIKRIAKGNDLINIEMHEVWKL